MFDRESILRVAFLHIIAVLFVIFNLSNIKISGVSNLIPLLDLMMIFYFGVFKQVFAIWFIFLLGIWNDALNGNPIGITALCYIILVKLFIFLNAKMFIKEDFKQIWQQFIFFCFMFLLFKWMSLSVLNGVVYGFATPIVQFILSVVIYVLMHRFFDYLSTKLLEGR